MPVDMRIEEASFRRELSHLREREHLESAGVREDGPIPSHEPVEPAHGGDGLGARPQHEVVGVAEYHRGAVLAEVARLERLHGGLRAHGHEYRRLHGPVRRVQKPGARVRTRVLP